MSVERARTKYQRMNPLSGGFAFVYLCYTTGGLVVVGNDRRLHSHFDILELALAGHFSR